MHATDLIRLLSSLGGSKSMLDTVVRSLREQHVRAGEEGAPFGLPVAGRGASAHQLAPHEVAWVLIAYAGSDVASRAGERLAELALLQSPEPFKIGEFVPGRYILQQAIEEALIQPAWREQIQIFSIARNYQYARLDLVTGSGDDRQLKEVKFYAHNAVPAEVDAVLDSSYVSTGIITRGLLNRVAAAMAGEA